MTAVVLLLAGWELWIWAGDVPPYVLAAPSESLAAAVTEWRTLAPQAAVTIKEIGLGFAACIVLGLILAVALDVSTALERAVNPYLVATQVVPVIAVAPTIVIWFGYGLLAKTLIVFVFGLFVIVLHALAGLRSVEEEKLHLARAMGAKPTAIFVKIKLPHALPHIFVGIKLAAALCVIGAVVAEYIGSSSGLGYLVVVSQARFETVTMLAAITWLIGIGLVVFFLVEALERRVIPWHVSQRRPEHTVT